MRPPMSETGPDRHQVPDDRDDRGCSGLRSNAPTPVIFTLNQDIQAELF
jgi:hypothetical protein